MSEVDAGETRSAIVIVRPPDYVDGEPITSANIHRALPTDEQVRLVQRLFTDAGFTVSEAFAGSFAITANAERFAEALPPLPTSACEGWLAPAAGLLHLVTEGDPVELDADL